MHSTCGKVTPNCNQTSMADGGERGRTSCRRRVGAAAAGGAEEGADARG